MGEENTLNRRGEYNRCKIARLTMGEKAGEDQKVEVEMGEGMEEVEEGLASWEGRKKEDRMKEGRTKTTAKRGKEEHDQKVEKTTKRRKYNLIEGWGEVDMVVVEGVQPYNPPTTT